MPATSFSERLATFAANWANIPVGTANFHEVHLEFRILLLLTPDGQPGTGTMADYIRRNPDGTPIELPAPLEYPATPEWDLDPTASQPAQTLYIQGYNIRVKIAETKQAAYVVTTDNIALLKAAILLADTWEPQNTRQAMGRGTQSVTDHPATMFSRLVEGIDVMDDMAVRKLSAIYEESFEGSFADLVAKETPINEVLSQNSRGLTSDQRRRGLTKVLQHRPETRAALDLFDNKYPAESSRTLENFLTFMTAQDPNIRRNMDLRRSAIYPQQAMTAAAAGNAGINNFDAISLQTDSRQTMFSYEQREEYALQAVAAAANRPKPQPRENNGISTYTYCLKHGHCDHDSAECKSSAKGDHCQWHKHDTRHNRNAQGEQVHDTTRVVGHDNCRHTPRCPSEEEARTATHPMHYPDSPGNQYVWSGSAKAGNRKASGRAGRR